MGNSEWNDHLSMVLIVGDNYLPYIGIVVANVKQYFVDEYARVLISVNQRIKLLSTVIRDIVLFRPEMKIKTRHHILPNSRAYKASALGA
jgi:hypothetical protein